MNRDEYQYLGRNVLYSGWPSGVYFPDASGGKHSNVPARRRCGMGAANLVDSLPFSKQFRFGLYAPLLGVERTGPRAELYGDT